MLLIKPAHSDTGRHQKSTVEHVATTRCRERRYSIEQQRGTPHLDENLDEKRLIHIYVQKICVNHNTEK